MRRMLLVVLLLSNNALAQYPYTDSLRRENNRMLVGALFWSEEEDGVHIGPVASYEMQTLGAGGEVKCYGAYYHYLLSGSFYANARHLYTTDRNMPKTAVGVGIHYLIFGLEGNAYLGGDRTRYYVTPKLGFDKGCFSVFYGYSIQLDSNNLSPANGHTLSVKYAVCLTAFKYHKSRRKSWIKHGLHPKFEGRPCR